MSVHPYNKYLSGDNIGDWSNGMIGVSKTFGGSSILSSPAKCKELKSLDFTGFELFFCA